MVRAAKERKVRKFRHHKKRRTIDKKSSEEVDGNKSAAPTDDDQQQKKQKPKKKLPQKLKECFECVDAGRIKLETSYLNVPPEPLTNDDETNGPENKRRRKNNNKKKGTSNTKKFTLESEVHEIGCIPWRLSLVHQLRKDANGGYSNHVLKLTLRSDFRKDIAWRAEMSGTLTMKKWAEKLPESTKKLDEHSERFATTFTHTCQSHPFTTEFPLQIANAADDVYLKNRCFKFELNFLLHNVQFSHLPYIDFHKKRPNANVLINIDDKPFYVNKAFLSMHSQFFATMFTAEGFVESREQKATLEKVSCTSFNEFLRLLHDPLRRPEGNFRFFKNLLELARSYMAQSITNRCEQQLLFMDDYDPPMVPVGQRMALADTFGLIWLKAKLIVKNPADDLLKLAHLSDQTRQMLLRKKNAVVADEEAKAKRKAEEEEKQKRAAEAAKQLDIDGKPGTSADAASSGRGRAGARGANSNRRGGGRVPRGGRGRGININNNNGDGAAAAGVGRGGRGGAGGNRGIVPRGGRGRGRGRGLGMAELEHLFEELAHMEVELDFF